MELQALYIIDFRSGGKWAFLKKYGKTSLLEYDNKKNYKQFKTPSLLAICEKEATIQKHVCFYLWHKQEGFYYGIIFFE